MGGDLNDEPRDDLTGAAEASASSEGSHRAPLDAESSAEFPLAGLGVDSSAAADAQFDDAEEGEDLTGTGEWKLSDVQENLQDTAVWKRPELEDLDGDGIELEGELEDDEDAADDQDESDGADAEPEVADSAAADVAEPTNLDWYILKVASNREESIKDGLLRRARIAGLDHYIKEIIVPTETISEYKNGKRRTRKQKVWPGYLVVNMEINEETWFLVRETPGIGDFTGAAGKPTPMLREEVEKILRLVRPPEERKKEPIKELIPFKTGDRVKIKEGTFQDFEGEVESVDQSKSSVTVMINIFGRPTPAEVSSWQLEAL
jgi:transcriptional antiterminator NusG